MIGLALAYTPTGRRPADSLGPSRLPTEPLANGLCWSRSNSLPKSPLVLVLNSVQSIKAKQIVNKKTGERIMVPVMPRPVLSFFRSMGRIGGSATSPAKTEAVRKNGKLGGRPRKHDATTLPPSAVLAVINRAQTKSAAD